MLPNALAYKWMLVDMKCFFFFLYILCVGIDGQSLFQQENKEYQKLLLQETKKENKRSKTKQKLVKLSRIEVFHRVLKE